MKQSIKNILSLAITLLVSAIVLFITHKVTHKRISEVQERARINAAKRVLPRSCKKIEPIPGFENAYIGKTSQGKVVAYAITASDPYGYGGDIKLIVGFMPDYTIISYYCIEQNESPDFGDLFLKPQFADQFRNLNALKDLALKVDGGEIVQIASATITSRSVCNVINNAKKKLTEILNASKETK